MKLNKIGIVLLGITLAALAGSIALNVALFDRAKQYYVELNQTRLDPSGLNAFSADGLLQKDLRQRRVVVFGDSRAASWVLPQTEGIEFVNRGIGSQTTIQVLQRFAAHVKPLQPDVVVVQVGINDLKTIALFPESREAIVATCKQNIRQIVQESRQLGATVILTTIFPAGDISLARQFFWSAEIDRAVQEVNASLKTLATDRVILLDTFALLADDRGRVSPAYQADELHLNERGYAVITPALLQQLETIQP